MSMTLFVVIEKDMDVRLLDQLEMMLVIILNHISLTVYERYFSQVFFAKLLPIAVGKISCPSNQTNFL